MLIRSITSFIHVLSGGQLPEKDVELLGDFSNAAIRLFREAGFEVQTTRLATNSFVEYLPINDVADSIEIAQRLAALSVQAGFSYLSLGPALPEQMESYLLIPEIFQHTENVFLTGNIVNKDGEISLPAVNACAKVMVNISTMIPNGFQNLYFAALANVPGETPFFPSAFAQQKARGFSLACEAADLAVEAFSRATTLQEAKQFYIDRLEVQAGKMTKLAEALAGEFQLEFFGIDLTPAPFVEIERSVGTALERLGAPRIGLHGSLSAAAVLMDAIDRANYKKAGFNGLMLPILEDAVLAQRVSEGSLTIKDLLMYSAVCGTGLDTVPIPGDVSCEQIAAVLLDVASLSCRLNKPLTARLMPIPGMIAGERTQFDFPFFVNSSVMALEAGPLTNLFSHEDTFLIEPRNKK